MANLKLVSSNPYPVASNSYPIGNITAEGLEAIKNLFLLRGAMFNAIDSIEEIFQLNIPYGAENNIFTICDVDFVDWPADKAITPERGQEFIDKILGLREIEDLSFEILEDLCQKIVDEHDGIKD